MVNWYWGIVRINPGNEERMCNVKTCYLRIWFEKMRKSISVALYFKFDCDDKFSEIPQIRLTHDHRLYVKLKKNKH